MKTLLIMAFITLSTINAWELKEAIDSEGIQTNVIKCDNGTIKAVYLTGRKYLKVENATVLKDAIEKILQGQ